MTDFVTACSLSDLADDKPKCVQVGGQSITLVKSKDKVYAVDGTCPHRGGPLAEGFHLDTGMYVGSPGIGIRTHATELKDGSVLVRL